MTISLLEKAMRDSGKRKFLIDGAKYRPCLSCGAYAKFQETGTTGPTAMTCAPVSLRRLPAQ